MEMIVIAGLRMMAQVAGFVRIAQARTRGVAEAAVLIF
jgi:hypothetical protein